MLVLKTFPNELKKLELVDYVSNNSDGWIILWQAKLLRSHWQQSQEGLCHKGVGNKAKKLLPRKLQLWLG